MPLPSRCGAHRASTALVRSWCPKTGRISQIWHQSELGKLKNDLRVTSHEKLSKSLQRVECVVCETSNQRRGQNGFFFLRAMFPSFLFPPPQLCLTLLWAHRHRVSIKTPSYLTQMSMWKKHRSFICPLYRVWVCLVRSGWRFLWSLSGSWPPSWPPTSGWTGWGYSLPTHRLRHALLKHYQLLSGGIVKLVLACCVLDMAENKSILYRVTKRGRRA